jgi:glycosyltransferase involved in cell wall biosynthesis
MDQGPVVQADCPRVLLVNYEPINRRYATGITMGSLFRGWPKDRIAQIYCDDSEPDTSICDRSWHLDLEDLRMPEWLRAKVVVAMKARRQRHAENQTGIVVAGRVRNTSSLRNQVFRLAKMAFFRGLEFSSYKVSPELHAWVRSFRPDVIYSILGDLHLLKLVQELSDDQAIPVVPHFMDDWIVSLHNRGLVERVLKHQLVTATRRIMRTAPTMMVISRAMAEEYEKRYQYVFVPFMNCIDPNGFGSARRHRYDGETFRFVYAGGLHLGRWQLLLDIGQVLSALTSSGTKAVIDVYAPNITDEISAHLSAQSVIRLCGAVPPDKVKDILANCDGLLHIESFEESIKHYTRYSMSTKIPEYLASGVAIFAYGPENLASIQYIGANNCGVVVEERNPELLTSRLQYFIADKGMRARLADNARTLCITNHHSLRQREQFRIALTQSR